LGLPFTTWSLTKLVDYLAEHAWITVTTETVRQILRKAGLSRQATKTWKASRDPDFVAREPHPGPLRSPACRRAGDLC
jgi:transposase